MNKTQELMKRIEVYFPTVVHERLLIDFGNINVRLLHEAYHELKRLNAIIVDDVSVIPMKSKMGECK